MNQAAYDAVNNAWAQFVKSRALCPYTTPSAIGRSGYYSPPWYQQRGARYFVNLAQPLTADDVEELNQIAGFINRSFVISMLAILESYDVVPYGTNPDRSRPGGDHAQLTKWLRNRFAHGNHEYNADDARHVETRELLVELFPEETEGVPWFPLSIDTILEPLKEGVLEYIRSA